MTPDPRMVRKLRAYDPELFVKWNNKDKVWEIWRNMPHGQRLITPVTAFIYSLEKPDVGRFVKIDNRIMNWLYQADSQGKGRKSCQSISYIRGKNKREFVKQNRSMSKKHAEGMEYLWRENYMIANRTTLNPYLHLFRDDSNYVAPDVKARGRVSTRSGGNAKKYFEGQNEGS